MRFYATHLILFVNFSTGKIGWLLRSLKVKKEKKNTRFISVSSSLYWITWCRHPQFTSDCLSLFFVFLFSPPFLLELSRVDWNIDRMSFIQCLLSATHRFFDVTSGLLFRTRSNPINCLFAAIVVSLSRFNQTNAKDSDKVRYFLKTLYRFHGEYPQSNISSILNKSRNIFWLSIS